MGDIRQALIDGVLTRGFLGTTDAEMLEQRGLVRYLGEDECEWLKPELDRLSLDELFALFTRPE